MGHGEWARFGSPDCLLANVNTPDDLARIRSREVRTPIAAATPGMRPIVLQGHKRVKPRSDDSSSSSTAPRARLAARLTEIYGLAPADQPATRDRLPANRALGDLAVPVAFELARRLRKAPRAIAQELAAHWADVEGFARIEADRRTAT